MQIVIQKVKENIEIEELFTDDFTTNDFFDQIFTLNLGDKPTTINDIKKKITLLTTLKPDYMHFFYRSTEELPLSLPLSQEMKTLTLCSYSPSQVLFCDFRRFKQLPQRDISPFLLIPFSISHQQVSEEYFVEVPINGNVLDIKEILKRENITLSSLENSQLLLSYQSNYLNDETSVLNLLNSYGEPSKLILKVKIDDGSYSSLNYKKYEPLFVSDDQIKLGKLLKEYEEIDVIPVHSIPSNYQWIFNVRDYSDRKSKRKEASLTDAQINAIKLYTDDNSDTYFRINFFLNTLSTPPPEDREFIETLMLACVDSDQPSLPFTVYRFCSINNREINSYKENINKRILIPGFFSTSRKPLKQFGDENYPVCFVINLIRGRRRGVIDLKAFSKFPEEEEVLLSAFSFYFVKSVEVVNNRTTITLDFNDVVRHHR